MQKLKAIALGWTIMRFMSHNRPIFKLMGKKGVLVKKEAVEMLDTIKKASEDKSYTKAELRAILKEAADMVDPLKDLIGLFIKLEMN